MQENFIIYNEEYVLIKDILKGLKNIPGRKLFLLPIPKDTALPPPVKWKTPT